MSKERSIAEIRKKIADGSAVVMTAHEICQLTQQGKNIAFEDVDVVTTATKGLMSGTSAIMAFRVDDPKKFSKVRSISMNDISCYVGPCPNETLGLVDLIIYATDRSVSNPKYGAGHLFRDLVEGKPVIIDVVTSNGNRFEKEITLDDIYFANMLGIRHAFRNYNSFLNPSDEEVKSIFTVVPMEPHCSEISFCGCGVINPLENDPHMDILGIGTPILVNGALGHIIGSGTRSSPQRPNLMTMAPMFDMIPEFMGGFITANGAEVIVSIAAAIPILNEKIFGNLKLTDSNCDLNLVDIVGRKVVSTVDYSKVWKQNLTVKFTQGICATCSLNNHCPVVEHCPTDCFTVGEGMDRTKCFNCGTCIKVCPNEVFKCDLGTINYQNKDIPIVLRQSDRNGAIKLMDMLKKRIIKGNFPIVEPTGKPEIFVEKVEKEREQTKK